MMYKMAFAFVEILADVNFVSIAITRTNNSVAAIAGKGWVTASAARREAGLWAVLQRTGHRSCRVVPHHVVLQSRRMTAAQLQSRRILKWVLLSIQYMLLFAARRTLIVYAFSTYSECRGKFVFTCKWLVLSTSVLARGGVLRL